MPVETITIPRRFCGPSYSGNGGYTSGRVASAIPGTATVRLMAPPPLDTPLQLETADKNANDGVRLFHGETLIAEARPAALELEPPVTVSLAQAEAASRSFAGFEQHNFPNCFVCGPHRAAGDGMRIFPGALGERGVVAAPWIADSGQADDEDVPPEFLWAALDCPGAFAVMPESEDKAIVLGQFTVRIDQPVRNGDRCAVIGWRIGIEGRKRFAGTALFAESGALVAIAHATWIEIPKSAFPAEDPV